MSGEGGALPNPNPCCRVVDMAGAAAASAGQAARDCATQLVLVLDRYRQRMPHGDMAMLMGAEAVALLAADVALVAGKAAGAAGHMPAFAEARLLVAQRHIEQAMDGNFPAIQQRLAQHFLDGDL